MNYNNKNIKKPSISNYMGFKKNFKKINSEVLNNKKNTVNNFEENKVSDNLIKTGKLFILSVEIIYLSDFSFIIIRRVFYYLFKTLNSILKN